MEEAYYHVDKDKLKKVKLMITESELSEKDKEIQNLIADGLLEKRLRRKFLKFQNSIVLSLCCIAILCVSIVRLITKQLLER